MYLIKAGDEVIHDGMINDKDYVALSAVMKTEFNRAGTLSFTVPSNNNAYRSGYIKKLKSIIRVYDRYGTLKWKGRVLDTSKDFYGRMTYNCEGWLSVLNDSVVRPQGDKDKGIKMAPAAMFSMLITQHNSQVENNKRLAIHTMGFSSTAVTFPYPSYETTLDYIQSNLVGNEDVGGRIWVTDTDIYFYADGTEGNSTQSIVFGKNLLELVDTRDASEVYTVLIPVGKDGLTLTGAYSRDYVDNTDGIAAYGRIVRHEEFSDISTAAALKTKADEVLAKNINESFNIEATAFDLGLSDRDAGTISVGTYGEVYSPPHGLSQVYICTAIEIDMCNPANSRFTFGRNPDTLTTKQLKLTKRVDANARYAQEVNKIDMSYAVFENAVEVNNITFYRAGSNVHLSFAVKFLKEVPNDRASILTFNNKYAPSAVLNLDDAATDETQDKTYRMRITTDGKIQVFNNSEIAVDDIVTGTANWVYS